MKKDLKSLLFEEEQVGSMVGSKTASGKEMIYVFSLPVEGVPIDPNNFALHNLLFDPEKKLSNKGEPKERANVHLNVNFVPWLIIDGQKELDFFKKKIIQSARSKKPVNGLEPIISKQVSRRGTSDKDTDTEKKESGVENIIPVSHSKLKIGAPKLAKKIKTKINGGMKIANEILKLESEEEILDAVGRLKKNPLGELTRDKIRQICTQKIPMSTGESITLMIKPMPIYPSIEFKSGNKMLDQKSYLIYEQIQLIFFVLEVIEDKETEDKETEDKETEDKETEDKETEEHNESKFYFHKKTISENLNLLEAIGSTETSYFPLDKKDLSKKWFTWNKDRNPESEDEKKLSNIRETKKLFLKYNLVSNNTPYTNIWGKTFIKKYELDDDTKNKNIKKIKAKHTDIDIEDPDHSYIFEIEKDTIDYKTLRIDARNAIRDSYYSIMEEFKGKSALKTMNEMISKKFAISSGTGFTAGALLGWNIFTAGGGGISAISNILFNNFGSTVIFGPMGPVLGLIGTSAFSYVFSEMDVGENIKSNITGSKHYHKLPLFGDKQIKVFGDSLVEIAVKAKSLNLDLAPQLYLESTRSGSFKIDANNVEKIFIDNGALYQQGAKILSFKTQSGKEKTRNPFTDRKRFSKRKQKKLKDATYKFLPEILKDLFDVEISNLNLTDEEKKANKALAVIRNIDASIKKKTNEGLEKIPFDKKCVGYNTGVHFVAYLNYVSKKTSMSKQFKGFVEDYLSLEGKEKKIFDTIIEHSSSSNKDKCKALLTIFPHPSNLANILYKYNKAEFEDETTNNIENEDDFTAWANLDVVKDSGESANDIISSFNYDDYSNLGLYEPVVVKKGRSFKDIKLEILKNLNNPTYNVLSSTAFLLAAVYKGWIKLDMGQFPNHTRSHNGVTFVELGEYINNSNPSLGTYQDLFDELKKGQEYKSKKYRRKKTIKKWVSSSAGGEAYLDPEKNQAIYIHNAYESIANHSNNFQNSINSLVKDFLRDIDKYIYKYKKGVLKKDASGNPIIKHDFDSDLIASRIEYDIKLFVLLCVCASIPGNFRNKVRFVHSFARSDTSKQSKVKAYKLAASNYSIAASVDPKLQDSYIYNKKLKFLVD
jgi:hypothetical protein